MSPERRLRFFIYARILVAVLLLASTVLFHIKDPQAVGEHVLKGMLPLVSVAILFSLVSLLRLHFRSPSPFFIYLQSIWDILFVTLLILFTGGIESQYSFLYLLAIMNAGVFRGNREAFYAASLCSILYGAIIDFQYFGHLKSIGLEAEPAILKGGIFLLYTIFLNIISFFMAAFFTGYLADRAIKTEKALIEKTIDLEELERLSSTIVSTLESGVLTINSAGRIRVFNRHASILTGRNLADVYDLPLTELFRVFEGMDLFGKAHAGEFSYRTSSGDSLEIGFSSVPFRDATGQSTGAVINFRDITDIRRMQETIKKKDRLAALGELSARMAHEIRNPLAAISGSVQMLAGSSEKGSTDDRLLGIVVREAERLNLLISEFLAYARPAAPNRDRVELKKLLDDIFILLRSESSFNAVVTQNFVPLHMTVSLDINQISQVFINLFRNSAEAMENGGKLWVEAGFVTRGAGSFFNRPYAEIRVSDSGPGLPAGAEERIFEPFWTTKPDGTGLGLAIIYRIIEAHGGTIQASNPPEGGCTFVIQLPV